MKENLHYILEEDGRSIIVENGIVSSTSTPTPLANTPDGWRDILINWERSWAWFAVIRSFTTPLAFVLSGAKILRHAVYTQNIERRLLFLIQRLVSEVGTSLYRLVYRYLYRGEIDLSTFKDEETQVTCAIMEGGLSKQLKANENTPYTLPLAEDPDAKDLVMDGVLIKSIITFLSINQFQDATELGGLVYNSLWLSVQYVSSEGTLVNGAGFSTQPLVTSDSSSHYDDAGNVDNNFFIATSDITLNIQQTITATLHNGLSLELYIKNSNGTRTQLLFLAADNPTGTVPFSKTQTFNIDIDIPVAQGEKLYLISELRESILIIGDTIASYEEFQIILSFDSTYRRSIIKFFEPADAYRKLVGKVTGVESNAESNLLISKSEFGLTCGDAIRSLSGASIKTSIRAFFEDYNVTCFAGVSVDNGKIKLETRPTYFDESNPIDLGAVKDLEVTIATDIMGNTIKVGHTKPDIEDVNGKYDPNGSVVFTTPITKIVREINLVGPYKKGPYEIEITRINLDGKTTTDNDNDNDCFVIHVKKITDTFTVDGSFDDINKFTLTGMAGNIAIFEEVMAFYLDALGNRITFFIKEVVVNGVDLDITVENPVNGSGGPFTGYIITFPYILNRDAVVDNDIDVCPSPDTIFNVALTPRNILKTHGRWLRSLFYGFDSEKFIFQSGDKNTKFLATVNGVLMDEDADENIFSLGDLLFLPFYFEFTTEVPTDLVTILETNTNRCFSFTWNGNTFKGFLIKASQSVNTEQAQRFRLLSAPSNDLNQLVV